LAASAPADLEAPGDDNYLSATSLNTPGTQLTSVGTLTYVSDTTGATVQQNLLSPCGSAACHNGPSEPVTCNGTGYGKTVWYDFYPQHNGQIEVRTVGFPDVIALYQISQTAPILSPSVCRSGSTFASNELFSQVQQGRAYALQIGGRDNPSGPSSGPYEMQFNYVFRNLVVPPFLASARIEYTTNTFDRAHLLGLTLLELASGETISFACSRCGARDQDSAEADGTSVSLAALGSPSVSKRTRLLVAATAPAEVGRYKVYGVDVRGNALLLETQGCLAPGVTVVAAGPHGRPARSETTRCPSPPVDPFGAEYVFWRGADGRLWGQSYTGSEWTAPKRLRSGQLAPDSVPAVAVHSNGEQDVFWRGPNGGLWAMWYTNQWNGPIKIYTGQLGSDATAGVDGAGDEHVFWKGADGNLWETAYTGSGWTAPIGLNSGQLGSAPAVAVHQNGEQDIFWKGTDGHLWEMSYTNVWTSPKNLLAGQLGSGPSVGVDAAGDDYVFWKGTDGRLWERYETGGRWDTPTQLPSGLLGSAPTVAVHAVGEQDVFWKGTDGNVWEMWDTGHWYGPRKILDGRPDSAPAAGVVAVSRGATKS
jgi:hypothetical protein